jgi:hypothetical protein
LQPGTYLFFFPFCHSVSVFSPFFHANRFCNWFFHLCFFYFPSFFLLFLTQTVWQLFSLFFHMNTICKYQKAGLTVLFNFMVFLSPLVLWLRLFILFFCQGLDYILCIVAATDPW